MEKKELPELFRAARGWSPKAHFRMSQQPRQGPLAGYRFAAVDEPGECQLKVDWEILAGPFLRRCQQRVIRYPLEDTSRGEEV